MPLLDIATPQPSFRNQLYSIRFQRVSHVSYLFSNQNSTRLGARRRYFCIPDNPNEFINTRRGGGFMIKAVTTLEPRQKNDNVQPLEIDSTTSLPATEDQSSSEDSTNLDEKERLKRMKISKAMKGKTPWNKGKKHSQETLQRIRERTRIAMQDPKVKMKLVNLALGHARSDETKVKIGVGLRIHNERRRQKLMVQETCHFEWLNLIAEASRKGLCGEEELQWDSYKIMDEQLQKEWIESIEHRRRKARVPLSSEHRKKISETIAAKWADNSYRDRVYTGLSKYHGTTVGNAKPRRRATSDREPRETNPSKKSKDLDSSSGKMTKSEEPRATNPSKKSEDLDSSSRKMTKSESQQPKSNRNNTPLCKDPQASDETRIKIGVGLRLGCEGRSEKLTVQETCHFEWLDLIAEASRKGLCGQKELQWNSYEIMNEQLKKEWIESIEQRKRAIPEGRKRKPWSPEHRRHLSQTIAARYAADNTYRARHSAGMRRHHATTRQPGYERPRKEVNVQETCLLEWLNLIAETSRKGLCGEEELQWDSYKIMREQLKEWISAGYKEINLDRSSGKKTKLKRSKLPMYKDPEASSKLEMIKSIRAQRAAADTKKSEAITRAQTASADPKTSEAITRAQRTAADTKSEAITRAQRAVADTKKSEAIARAKLLIAEAQRGAEALEIAAATSPIAQATLIETRKIIAEAIRSLESLQDTGDVTVKSSEIEKEVLSQTDHRARGVGLSDAEIMEFGFSKLDLEDDDEPSTSFHDRDLVNGVMGLSDAEIMDFDFSKLDLEDDDELVRGLVNGVGAVRSSDAEIMDFDFSKLDLQDDDELHTSSHEHGLVNGNVHLSTSSETNRKQETRPNTSNKTKTKTKRWVRGKLVEVDEDD